MNSPGPVFEPCSVLIVESPSPEDLYDDRREGRTLRAFLDLARVTQTYRLAADRGLLEDALHEFSEDDGNRFLTPIVHISAHGLDTGDGIALTHDQLTWEELGQLLAPVYRAYGDRLILCLSVCRGSSAWLAASPKGIRFNAMVTSLNDVPWDSAALAFCTFYFRLSKGASLREAVDAMNASIGTNAFNITQGEIAALMNAMMRFQITQKLREVEGAVTRLRPVEKRPSPNAGE